MSSIVKTTNGKYKIYDRCGKYLSFQGRELSSFQPETRNVIIDWKKAFRHVEWASTNLSGINNDVPCKSEKNKDVVHIGQLNLLESISESEFWYLIEKIRCCDRDDGNMSKKHIRLNSNECRKVLMAINNKYIPELKNVLDNVPIPYDIDCTEYNNLLTHVIVKGKDFYMGIIENPYGNFIFVRPVLPCLFMD